MLEAWNHRATQQSRGSSHLKHIWHYDMVLHYDIVVENRAHVSDSPSGYFVLY